MRASSDLDRWHDEATAVATLMGGEALGAMKHLDDAAGDAST
jgi:hypothetical protein